MMTRRIELSPRLRLAADLVPKGARLADVGTDHAYLPACLLMEGKIPSAIAADLREGPLSRARETAADPFKRCTLPERSGAPVYPMARSYAAWEVSRYSARPMVSSSARYASQPVSTSRSPSAKRVMDSST